MSAQPLRAVPHPPRTADLDSLVARHVALDQQAAELEAERRQIKVRLLELLEDGTHETSFGIKVNVRGPSRQFDVDVAKAMLSARDPDAFKACEKTVVDSARVKKALTGNELEAAMLPTTGPRVVTIK